jgi:hypothetical protein
MPQLLLAVSIAQESVVANAMESSGKNVEEKTSDELIGREGHDFLLIVVAVVPPMEFHLLVFAVHESIVGNSNTVSVTADVVYYLLRAREGRFGVDDPFLFSHCMEITGKGLPIVKYLEGREELQLAGIEGLLQVAQEQPAKQTGQHSYWQEESGAARNPVGTIGRDSAARDDTMQVGMMEKILSPGVKHGEETDLGGQMFGIGSYGGQGLGRGSEQDAVDEIFVLVGDGSDVFGQRKNHVEVWAVQDFGFSFFDPLRTSERLAFGAMSITAAVVAGPLVMTGVAAFEMTAKSCRSTHLDRGHDAPLCGRKRCTMLQTIVCSIEAEHVRHFPPWAVHWARRLEGLRHNRFDYPRNGARQQVERARCRTHLAGRDAEIFCCGGQTAMSQQQLNGAHVGALLE